MKFFVIILIFLMMGCVQNNELKRRLAEQYSIYNHIEVLPSEIVFTKIRNIYLVGHIRSKGKYDIGVINPELYTNLFLLGKECSIANVASAEPLILKLYDEGNSISSLNFNCDSNKFKIRYIDKTSNIRFVEYDFDCSAATSVMSSIR